MRPTMKIHELDRETKLFPLHKPRPWGIDQIGKLNFYLIIIKTTVFPGRFPVGRIPNVFQRHYYNSNENP